MSAYRFNLLAFSVAVRQKRGEHTLRDAEEEIKQFGTVSIAALSRVESGRLPDFDTLGVLCAWMGKHPGDFFTTESGDVTLLDLLKRVEALEKRLWGTGMVTIGAKAK